MNNIIIENVIASTEINKTVTLKDLYKELKNDNTLDNIITAFDIEEESNDIEEEQEGLLSVLYTNDNDINLILFNDGRLVSVRATTIEDAEQSIIDFINLLEEKGFIEEE